MALTVTITPAHTFSATEKVTTSLLNLAATPAASVGGVLDLATQADWAAMKCGDIDLSAGATPVSIFAGVINKTIRALKIEFIRTSAIVAGSAIRVVVRTAAAVPTVIAYATLADVAANVVTPQASIVYTVTAMGVPLLSGSGIEVVIADVNNDPINGTSGTVTAAVSAIYE